LEPLVLPRVSLFPHVFCGQVTAPVRLYSSPDHPVQSYSDVHFDVHWGVPSQPVYGASFVRRNARCRASERALCELAAFSPVKAVCFCSEAEHRRIRAKQRMSRE
jgi:hypothetical protein